MARNIPQKLVRRLAAAEGFLELGMPQHALDELAAENDFGTLAAPADYLRGMAFKAQENYGEAIPAFQRAAKLIPVPFSQPVWRELSECLRQQGQDAMADLAETFADAPAPNVTLSPVINVEITIVASGEGMDDDEFEGEFDENLLADLDDDEDDGESWKGDDYDPQPEFDEE